MEFRPFSNHRFQLDRCIAMTIELRPASRMPLVQAQKLFATEGHQNKVKESASDTFRVQPLALEEPELFWPLVCPSQLIRSAPLSHAIRLRPVLHSVDWFW